MFAFEIPEGEYAFSNDGGSGRGALDTIDEIEAKMNKRSAFKTYDNVIRSMRANEPFWLSEP